MNLSIGDRQSRLLLFYAKQLLTGSSRKEPLLSQIFGGGRGACAARRCHLGKPSVSTLQQERQKGILEEPGGVPGGRRRSPGTLSSFCPVREQEAYLSPALLEAGGGEFSRMTAAVAEQQLAIPQNGADSDEEWEKFLACPSSSLRRFFYF